MTTETWLIILGISGINIFTLICGLVTLTTRLARIETNIEWILRECPQCQQS